MTRTRKQRSRRSMAYRLKAESRRVAYGVSVGFLMFSSLVVLSLGFILYQTKNHLIRKYIHEKQVLVEEILRLNSENNRYRTRIKVELTNYTRISRIAREKLGLTGSVAPPQWFDVDREELEKYARKDDQISEQRVSPRGP